jgi:hypothetical protein
MAAHMKNLMRAVPAVLLVAVAAAAVSAFTVPPARPQEKNAYKFAGIAGCSTKDCHGAEAAKGSPGLNEYAVWKKEDPHSKTFTTLYKGPSKAMGKAMGIAKVTDSPRCVNCHSRIVPAEQVMPGAKWALANGVSCEVCHGPGEKWFEPHATPKEKDWSHAKSVSLGMIDLRSLPVWAKECASCHLQIEPDLVAAGHPKLMFELVDYNARTGAHWKTEKHPSMEAGFDARAWTVGQLVSLAEATRNLAKRQDAKAPEERLKEAQAQMDAHARLLKHLEGFVAPAADAKLEEAAGAVEAQAATLKAADAAILAKFAAEDAPAEFMAARQLALAFRALSAKAEAKTSIDTLCEHIAAKAEPKFDPAKFAADYEAVRKHFK